MEPDHQVFAVVVKDDPEITGYFNQTMLWLQEFYPGLTPQQIKAMAEAIFEEALNSGGQAAVPDLVATVLSRYGLELPPGIAEAWNARATGEPLNRTLAYGQLQQRCTPVD